MSWFYHSWHSTASSNMPRRKQPKEEEDFVWRKSKAKLRILDDLKDGTLLLYERELSAKDAWQSVYKSKP
eukprot:10908028-Ditylum_brightwellii.AAC.1